MVPPGTRESMSREAILAAVRAQQHAGASLPAIPEFVAGDRDELVARFRKVLEQVGGTWAVRPPGSSVSEVVYQSYPHVSRIVSAVAEPHASTLVVSEQTPPMDLVQVELAIVRGLVGVAENAAVWVDGGSLTHRSLPFVAEHLVLLLSTSDIVPDMHAAYRVLREDRTGYGVFVSGPSKTADIEQALVIGAQGPRSLLVVFD